MGFFVQDGVASKVPLWDPHRGSLVRSARVVGNCSKRFYKSHCFLCWDYGNAKKHEMFIGNFDMKSGVVNTGDWYDGLHHVSASDDCAQNAGANTEFYF